MNKLGLSSILLSAFLLSGCGGSGDNDPMNDKNYIIIFEDIQADFCESDAFKRDLTNIIGLIGVLARETDNTTTCGTYEKVNDENECVTEYIGYGTLNCVVGFDGFQEDDIYAKRVSGGTLYNTIETISSSF